MVMEAAFQPMWRGAKRRIDISLADLELANQVSSVLFMQHLTVWIERTFSVNYGRQRLQIKCHQFGGIFGQIPAFRQNDRHSFPDMPHLVVGEERLLRIEEFVLDLAGPFSWQRQLGVRNWRQEPLQFGAAHHIRDAGRGRGSRHVDRSDPGVGNLASHKNGMQSIGKLQVRHELTLACQKPSILLAEQRTSDKTARMRLGHYLYSGADRILAAASMTAATMF